MQRAESLLSDGDVEGCLGVVQQLSTDHQKTYMREWIDQAKKRAQARQGIETLMTHARYVFNQGVKEVEEKDL